MPDVGRQGYERILAQAHSSSFYYYYYHQFFCLKLEHNEIGSVYPVAPFFPF